MRVLIGVDESPESRDAVRTAFEFFGTDCDYTIASIGSGLAANPDMVIAAGYPPGQHLSADYLERHFAEAEAAAAATAQAALEGFPEAAEVSITFEAEIGHVGSRLCRLADHLGSDVIVIGSQDKNVWQRLLDPSVGRYLIDHAPCPVVVVR